MPQQEIPPVIPPEPTQTSSNQPPDLLINTPSEFDVVKQQIAQLTQVVGNLAHSINAPRPVTPTPLPPLTRDEVENNPQSLVDRINTQISEAIAPLNQFRTQFERTNQYQLIKNQIKSSDASIAKFWHIIEPQLDATFSSGQIEARPELIMYHANAVLGNIARTNPSAFMAQASTTPPSMIPASGTPPPEIPKPKLRDLTENETMLAKQRGLTAEQFLQLQQGTEYIVPANFGGKK